MKFNNRENECVKLPNGKEVWLSRAVAVVGTVCLIKDEVPFFLISQRGSGAADNQGLWNLPCGYLDWDETTGEAFIREVWEECGVNAKLLIEDKNIMRINFVETPWDINSNTSENRQNVCIHHGLIGMVNELPTPEIKNEVEENEVADVAWVSIFDISKYEYAFSHEERIQKFIKKNFLDMYLKKNEPKKEII
jgi:8-oxo-dGTP pyrophosphatase MutT (NUDIX family)